MDVFLRVSPDQSQFFRKDSVSFSCGASEPWTVKRNTSSRSNQPCSEFGGVQSNSSCEYHRLYPEDSGLYWCEREDITSEPVNITVKDRGILLQIPVRPVSVGDSVFLSCRRESGPALPARFYRDGLLLLSEQPAGHNMSLQQVALADSGLYQCESGGQRSESSRLSVHSDEKVSSSPPPLWTSPVSPSVSPSPAPSPLLLPSIIGPVLLVLLVLLLVLVLLKRRRRRQTTERVEEGGADDVTYSDISHAQQRRPELELSPVYSGVKTQEVLYSDITVRGGAPGKKDRGGASELEPSPVYSAMKTQEVLYSHVTVRGGAPGSGAHRGGASDPQVIYSAVRGAQAPPPREGRKERKQGHKEGRT